MTLFKDRGQIFLDTEGHLLRILSLWTGPCRCSPFHFTKHFSPSLPENCLRLDIDNSFAQQGQSSGLVLLRHKSWMLQMRTWELKTLFMKNPKSKETMGNWAVARDCLLTDLEQACTIVEKNVKNSTDGKLM